MGNFTDYLQKNGHNDRPSMSPEERRQLMADLDQETEEVPQPDQHGGRLIATSFAPVELLGDAAAFLGIDLSDWENIKISPLSDLSLRVDQVQNIAFMVKNAEGILKGAVNANESGSGKTIEALATVFFLAKRRETLPEFAAHRATLILCPHQALRGWQDAYSRFFSKLLTLHVCSKSYQKAEHINFVDPKSVSALTEVLERMELSDCQTSYNIILSTYEEFSSKAFLKERKKEDILGKREFSVRASKLAPEAHHAIKIGQKPVLFDLEFKTTILEKIGTLIADEAHEMKDPRTRRAQAAYLVDADITFLLTATPTVNKISDFRGLLFALFRPKEWSINWPLCVHPGELLAMYTSDFDPFKCKDPAGVILGPGPMSPQYVEALRNGQHLWRLNPHAYRWLGNQMKFSPEFAQVVLGSIFRLCVLRRDPGSVVHLPGGIRRTIGDVKGIPRATINTVELKMTSKSQEVYSSLAESRFSNLFSTGDGKQWNAARVSGSNEVPLASFNKAQNAKLNYITADLDLEVAFSRPFKENDGLKDQNAEAIEAEELYGQEKHAGMEFYYARTRHTQDPTEPPSDRVSMIKHLVQQAPKLRWLLVKLDELKQRNEKAVVFCVHPRTQWMIEGVCSMAEFKFYSLRSKHDKYDVRPRVMEDFNDPAKHVDFLLSTVELVGSGVDLSRDCHNMVFFELPESVPMLMSAIGRIHRVGQDKPQQISILTLAGSYDDYTLHRHFKKYSIDMLAQGFLSGLIDAQRHPIIPQLAAGELVRRHLGARVNRSVTMWTCNQLSSQRSRIVPRRRRWGRREDIVKLADFHPDRFRNFTNTGKSAIDRFTTDRGARSAECAQDGAASTSAEDGGVADGLPARAKRIPPDAEDMDVDASEHTDSDRSGQQPDEKDNEL